MENYIEELISAYPAIKEIWLIGSRANGTALPNSDWDYLVFADANVLNALRSDNRFQSPSIDLLVVYDDNEFIEPWPSGEREKNGSLKTWGWQRLNRCEASYKGTKPRPNNDFYVDIFLLNANLVWPKD